MKTMLEIARLFTLVILLASSTSAQPISVDPTNPQYFRFQNQTIPLIGFSAEYICQIPHSDSTICNLDNYDDILNAIAPSPGGLGINKIRLWVGLNHSPGGQSTTHVPLTNEQPFAWVACPVPANPNLSECQNPNLPGKWDLNTWNNTYFNNLKNVVMFAGAKNPPFIVEVTAFDPWQGDFAYSPWNRANNLQDKGFTQEKYFAAYDNGTSDSSAQNQFARGRQIALLKKISDVLNNLDNVYYEIANEPDIDEAANGVTGSQVATWNAAMAQELFNYEGTKPKRHLIGVNFFTGAGFSSVTSPTSGNRFATVVSGHYAAVKDLTVSTPGGTSLVKRYGAIPMIQAYHNADGSELNRIFGFNETKAIAGVPSPQTPTGARAEAWEFMLNEGGMIDHYNLNWTTAAAAEVRGYLVALRKFLATFNLQSVQRVKAGTLASPNWAGLQEQNICFATGSSTGCLNWASFAWPGQQYGLYYHRGQLSNNPFRHYTVPAPGSYTLSLNLSNLGSGCTALQPCVYRYDWIEPSTAQLKCGVSPCTGTISWPGTGTVSLTSPTYSFDIALRLIRQ